MERRHHHLDRIDEQILAILKQEGRISYQKLADRVHLTPRPCQERVRKLEQAGYILGYTARLDEARLGRQPHPAAAGLPGQPKRPGSPAGLRRGSEPATGRALLLAGERPLRLCAAAALHRHGSLPGHQRCLARQPQPAHRQDYLHPRDAAHQVGRRRQAPRQQKGQPFSRLAFFV